MTSELLVGIDGVQKMSKSLGNAIGLTDAPYDMYARTMSIPDDLLPNWAGLVTRWTDDEARAFVADLEADRIHPKAAKQRLAREVVARWHSDDAADEAEERWEREVGGGEGISLAGSRRSRCRCPLAGISLPDVLVAAGLASSRSVGRRLVRQSGVRVDGEVQTDENRMFAAGTDARGTGREAVSGPRPPDLTPRAAVSGRAPARWPWPGARRSPSRRWCAGPRRSGPATARSGRGPG